MERYYVIAGETYCVAGQESAMLWDDGVLAPFASSKKEYSRRIDLKVAEQLSPPKGELVFEDAYRQVFLSSDGTQVRYEGVIDKDTLGANMRIERKGNLSFVQVKPLCLGGKSVLTAMEIEHAAAENSGVLFHAACICVQGKALVFTAPSGVGKSTQAQLWCEHRGAQLINGDRCIIRFVDGEYYICGVPYCGSSKVSHNVTLPLGAVIYLTRASWSQVQEVKGIQGFMHLWEGCCINTWNSNDIKKSVELVTSVAENVPVLRLDCTPDVSALEKLERCLKELNVLGE